jgi:hypothetical protein
MATCRPTLFLLTVKEILLVHFIITNFRVAHKMLCTPWLRNPLTTSRLSCLGRKAALTTIFLSVRQSRISQPCCTNNYFVVQLIMKFLSPVKNNRNTKCGKCHPNVSLDIFICFLKLFLFKYKITTLPVMQDSSHLTIIVYSSVIKIVISQKQKFNRKIIIIICNNKIKFYF